MKFRIICLFISAFLYGQKPVHTDIANSLQFGITDKFTLGEFDGSLISYKNSLTNKYALRISIGGDMNKRTEDNNNFRPSIDTLSSSRNGEYQLYNYEILFQILGFSKTNDNVRLYYGIGPIYKNEAHKGEYVDKYYYYDPDTIRSNSNEFSWKEIGMGFTGSIGAEWFVKNNISFVAEYGLSIISSKKEYGNESSPSYNNSISINKNIDTNIDINSRPVIFGLSFYIK